MKNLTLKIALIGLPVFVFLTVNASPVTKINVEEQMQNWLKTTPALNEPIEISVTDISIQEFLRGIANSVGLNLSVDPTLNINIINNFSGAKVADILIFLVKEYDLVIEASGNIYSIKKSIPPPPAPKVIPKKDFIIYNEYKDELSIDVQNDTLSSVCKEITNESGYNLILSPGISSKVVSSYIKSLPFDIAIKQFAYSNELTIRYDTIKSYILKDIEEVETFSQLNNTSQPSNTPNNINIPEGAFFKLRSKEAISVQAKNVNAGDIIKIISDSLKIDYTLTSKLEHMSSLNLRNVGYRTFLENVLKGSKYNFKENNEIFVIGDISSEAIHNTETILLKHRTITGIADAIPDDYKQGLTIKEFVELNSLVVTGTPSAIKNLKKFLQSIDKTVPVILIEILIIDVYKSDAVATGISAGFGKNPNPSSQTVLPGIDYEFSTEEINNLFNKIDGLGWVNLGKVSPDFYFAIKALETNNYIKIRSTPKLSTINGHVATLTSGEIRYYKEERNDYIGSQNPSLSSSAIWKPLEANLSVTIKPIVSGDENITLEIDVSQAEFQKESEKNVPPGSVTRTFKSLIRMNNKEMILLGGLDKVTVSEDGSGVPFLSRIPVIKWFFSSRSKSKTDTKLSIFIQPTVIY